MVLLMEINLDFSAQHPFNSRFARLSHALQLIHNPTRAMAVKLVGIHVLLILLVDVLSGLAHHISPNVSDI